MLSPLQIDLQGVLRAKLGERRMRLIPRWLIGALERMLCVPQMNDLLRATYPAVGGDFARRVLEELEIDVEVQGREILPPRTQRRVMLVSNHPLGGVEGMALIQLMSEHFGGRVYVMVNDILMAIEPLREVFLPINKHGQQAGDTVRRVDEVMASDNPVLIFPAGLVSRLQPGIGIHDLPWRPTFVNQALRSGRSIVPVFCGGRNSMFFYRIARLREKAGLRLNLVIMRLPREVFRQQGRKLSVVVGETIEPGRLSGGVSARETAAKICDTVYRLGRRAAPLT